MATPITDEERARLRELHAQGKGRNEIAEALGRSAGVVTKIAKALGLSFDRSATRAATEAKVADAKARRATLMHGYLDDAERLRQQIWEPATYREHGGRDFVRQEWTQNEPTPVDKLKLMQASTTAAAQSLRLDLHDADQQGLAAVDAWLRDIAGGD